MFLMISIVCSMPDNMFAMEEGVNAIRADLNKSILTNNFDAAVVAVKQFHQLLLSQKMDDKKQEELCDLLFAGLVEKVSESQDLSFKLICFILAGAGYSVNEFLSKRKDHLPLFLLNIRVYENSFENAQDLIKRNDKSANLEDSLAPLASMGKTCQKVSVAAAAVFLKDEGDLSTVIARRYSEASKEPFESDLIVAINQFFQDTFFNHFLNVALDVLYQSKDNSEFTRSLVILLELLNESKKDIVAFLRAELDISRINLFKEYREQFAKYCEQEATLTMDEFLKTVSFFKLRDFSDMLQEIFEQAKISFKKYPNHAPKNILQLLEQLKKNIINFMFISLFENFNGKNCIVSIYKILDKFGLEILDLEILDKDNLRQQLLYPMINVKQLVELNNKPINEILANLVVQLVFHYVNSGKYDGLISLFDHLNNTGFAVELIINSFAQSIAQFIKQDANVESVAKALGNTESKSDIKNIMAFINNDMMNSKYKFDNYQDLIDKYIRTYTLVNYLQAKFDYEFSVVTLLNKGVKINARDVKGNSPLLYALYHGNLSYVKLLVDKGADINMAAKDGITPLMKAILKNDKGIIKFLLEHGANPGLKDIYGDDAWSFAQNNSEITGLLKDSEKRVAGQILTQQVVALGELSTQLHCLANKTFLD